MFSSFELIQFLRGARGEKTLLIKAHFYKTSVYVVLAAWRDESLYSQQSEQILYIRLPPPPLLSNDWWCVRYTVFVGV